MTDRINSLTVILEKDFREDDVEDIINAIYMVKGVLSVQKQIANVTDMIAAQRVRAELQAKIWEVLK